MAVQIKFANPDNKLFTVGTPLGKHAPEVEPNTLDGTWNAEAHDPSLGERVEHFARSFDLV